jgi:hypothetical protein
MEQRPMNTERTAGDEARTETGLINEPFKVHQQRSAWEVGIVRRRHGVLGAPASWRSIITDLESTSRTAQQSAAEECGTPDSKGKSKRSLSSRDAKGGRPCQHRSAGGLILWDLVLTSVLDDGLLASGRPGYGRLDPYFLTLAGALAEKETRTRRSFESKSQLLLFPRRLEPRLAVRSAARTTRIPI